EQVVDPVLDIEIEPRAVERRAGEQLLLRRQLAGGDDGVVLSALADGVQHARRQFFLRCHEWDRVAPRGRLVDIAACAAASRAVPAILPGSAHRCGGLDVTTGARCRIRLVVSRAKECARFTKNVAIWLLTWPCGYTRLRS